MKKSKETIEEKIKKEEEYVAFLFKALKSDNYKKSVSTEEYKKAQNKYDKAKLKLRFLKDGN